MKDYLTEARLLEKRITCVSKKDDPTCMQFADADSRALSCAVEKKEEEPTSIEEPVA